MDGSILATHGVPSNYRGSPLCSIRFMVTYSMVATFYAELSIYNIDDKNAIVFVEDYADIHEFIGMPPVVCCGTVTKKNLLIDTARCLTKKFHQERIAIPAFPTIDELSQGKGLGIEEFVSQGCDGFAQEALAILWGDYGERQTLVDLIPELTIDDLTSLWDRHSDLWVKESFAELRNNIVAREIKLLKQKLQDEARQKDFELDNRSIRLLVNSERWGIDEDIVKLLKVWNKQVRSLSSSDDFDFLLWVIEGRGKEILEFLSQGDEESEKIVERLLSISDEETGAIRHPMGRMFNNMRKKIYNELHNIWE